MYANRKKMQIIIISCIFLYLTSYLLEKSLNLSCIITNKWIFLIVFDQWRHLLEKY